ncbi:TIGR00300 family protein [uncultured Methanosphaera sp.]|uniref:ornithine cyclodeaminase n=1 Tax=uncultured Methanosphaera sp. TaxID=262501 RepID=UPI0025972681|nr:TIGR00300 family protein [uncultured Methanosphaera sp.]
MYTQRILLHGHIIDSLTLPKTMDTIIDQGGDYEIEELQVGKLKTDKSTAKLIVKSDDEEIFNRILDILTDYGAELIEENEEVTLVASQKDKTVPDNFYSTSNYNTKIRYDGEWLNIDNIEMDCVICVDTENKKATCKPLNAVKKGEMIVTGRTGVKVTPLERSRGKNTFEFMNSEASAEKPTRSIIHKVATQMKEVKDNGGKIVVVGGPAVVHTGCAPILADLIKEGYVDKLFAGNALATHDIENAFYGTSLGVKMETGELVAHGHKHHISAINIINKAGSIKDAVEQGILKSGIMYECVKNNAPFVLAGSIRDDGPLPDVITDSQVAQQRMREEVQDVDMVIMIATLLHSVATGNLIPARIKSVCVDISNASVTKLADRGSAQVISVVTDIGSFLPILKEELNKLEE